MCVCEIYAVDFLAPFHLISNTSISNHGLVLDEFISKGIMVVSRIGEWDCRLIIWLVVSTPLNYISQSGLLFPIYGKIKMFQTTNQLKIEFPHFHFRLRWWPLLPKKVVTEIGLKCRSDHSGTSQQNAPNSLRYDLNMFEPWFSRFTHISLRPLSF